MKMTIRTKAGFRFWFFLPLSALRWPVCRHALADNGIESKELYLALKKEKRRLGRFLFLEAVDSDGTCVRIYL